MLISRRSLTLLLGWACASAMAAQAFAQSTPAPPATPELITDRPDFTESSQVLPRRWMQFETGVTFESDGRDVSKTRSVSFPSALVRIGLGVRTELRIGAEGYITERQQTGRSAGYSDAELGVKVSLLEERRAGLDLSVIPMASFPTGGAGFTSDGVDPTIKITLGRSLGAGFDLAGNVNFSWITEGDTHFSQQALSVSLNREIGRGWLGYAEIYGFSRVTRSEGAAVTVNGGVSRQFARRVQIDMEAGRALTDEAPNWFAGAGFAVLLPYRKP